MRIIDCECGVVSRLPDHSRSLQCACGALYDAETGLSVPPTVWERGINYSVAWAKWVKEGRPTRAAVEVDRLRAICGGCKFFDGTICTHKKCGCSVSQPGVFGDKLKWATEHCPIEKW